MPQLGACSLNKKLDLSWLGGCQSHISISIVGLHYKDKFISTFEKSHSRCNTFYTLYWMVKTFVGYVKLMFLGAKISLDITNMTVRQSVFQQNVCK